MTPAWQASRRVGPAEIASPVSVVLPGQLHEMLLRALGEGGVGRQGLGRLLPERLDCVDDDPRLREVHGPAARASRVARQSSSSATARRTSW